MRYTDMSQILVRYPDVRNGAHDPRTRARAMLQPWKTWLFCNQSDERLVFMEKGEEGRGRCRARLCVQCDLGFDDGESNYRARSYRSVQGEDYRGHVELQCHAGGSRYKETVQRYSDVSAGCEKQLYWELDLEHILSALQRMRLNIITELCGDRTESQLSFTSQNCGTKNPERVRTPLQTRTLAHTRSLSSEFPA
jgi:hypothetical protein